MFFTCDVRDLNRAIKVVRRHCSSRAVIPITKCIRFEAMTKDRVSLATTDMTTSAIYTMDVERVSSVGTLAIPLKELSALCGKLRGRVSLSAHEGQVLLVNGDDKYYISSLPGEEFPTVVFDDEFETISLPRTTIEKALSLITPTLDPQNPKKIMTGILLELEDKKLFMVGTDGKRMGIFQADISESKNAEVVVRPECLSTCIEAAEKQDEIELGISSKRMRISVSGFQIYTQRLDGRFVAFRKFIPNHFDQSFRVNRESLIEVLERCLIFAQEKKHPGFLVCNFDSAGVRVKACTAGLGEASGSISGEYEGDDLLIGWNGNYVLDALRVLDCEEVLWQMRGGMKSGQFTAGDDPLGFRYIVSPVKISEPDA